MKRLLLLMLVGLLCSNAGAQNLMNFQGKVALNNTPVNSNGATLRFEIPAINWHQDFLGNVKVQNGLFSVTLDLPQNVFDSVHASRRMAVLFNGNLLDTFTVLAPIERDPTVRSYIRDSVQWLNIKNKPTIDTSFTNELQTLSRNGDTLSISEGNSILIPRLSDTVKSLTVNGKFTVIDTAQNVMAAVPQTGVIVVGTQNQVYWQSFKATANGRLRRLKITAGASPSTSITVTLYAGVGNLTQAIAFKSFIVSAAAQPVTLDFTAGLQVQPYVSFTNGQLYTFEIKPTVGSSVSILTDPANPYAAGISSLSQTTDIPFEIAIDNAAPSCLTFDNNCRVGIGTDAPTSQLEVRGRIKDITGFVAPVGSIMAYGGRNVPPGWLLCDGRAISRTTYADLFEAIDTSWGAGNSSGNFHLPDLRGQFLRGVDTSVNVGSNQTDPEHETRTSSNTGGNSGNQVGSKQSDMFSSHNHSGSEPIFTFRNPGGCCIGNGGNLLGTITNTNNAGGSETRPKNAYVYYIIKY